MIDFDKLEKAELASSRGWPLPKTFLEGLERVGVSPHSDVGGAGAQSHQGEGAGTEDTVKSVAYWGICDVKYDPRAGPGGRVKLLELGDGRSSRFSHHGRPIKERFDKEYRLDAVPIKRGVMVENKKFTHDMFVQEGFSHLRPFTTCYPRRYTNDLAAKVANDLRLEETGAAVVLKLCNRARGAGVVVCSAGKLNATLHKLLVPPLGHDFEEWLQARTDSVLDQHFDSLLEEQCLHWWSNECPVFVAERCCKSMPVEMVPGSGEYFDGTLRVAFALHRRISEDAQADAQLVQPFEIDWLGGYWKMPRVAADGLSGNSLEDLHAQVVSSFNSVEKRTAEVAAEHLAEVYAALTPALPRVFQSGALSVTMIMSSYKEDPLFCAFALSHVAAVMRPTNVKKALGLFDLAKRMLPRDAPTNDEADFPERAVLSYIQRNLAACDVIRHDWEAAADGFQAALKTFPTNATAYFLKGCCCYERSLHDDAVQCMKQSLALDPDFRSPYVALGTNLLLLGQYAEASHASERCLQRHPDSPGAQFNVGQALYHLLHEYAFRQEEVEVACSKARAALEIARERMPDNWQDADTEMLNYVAAESAALRNEMPQQQVHGWRNWFFRP